ncbi:MAG: type II toxin-antitoxin system RatA family toxin [Alphaproteobacteria bacterium]
MPSYSETRFLPYRPEQMFDLVADVERYPEFLPWCVGARIRERHADRVIADLAVGFMGIRETFTSTVGIDRDRMLITMQSDRRPFERLDGRWQFGVDSSETGCVIDFNVDFEFRSRLLGAMMGGVFGDAVRHMVGAFEQRAAVLYGGSVSAP